jgi:hypothetical protein
VPGGGAVHSIKSGLMHRSKQHLYSITSSAQARSVGGTSRSSALAVLRLITNSNLVGRAADRHVSKAREISAGPVKTGNEAFCHRIGSK